MRSGLRRVGCGPLEAVTLSSSRLLRCSRTVHCRRRSGTACRPFTVSAVTGVGIRRRRISRGVFSRSYSYLFHPDWISCSGDGRHVPDRCLVACRRLRRFTLAGPNRNRHRGGPPLCREHSRRCRRRARRRLLAYPVLWPSHLDVDRRRVECARRLRSDVGSEGSSIVHRRSSIVHRPTSIVDRRSSSVETPRSPIVKSPAWVRAFESGQSPITDDGRWTIVDRRSTIDDRRGGRGPLRICRSRVRGGVDPIDRVDHRADDLRVCHHGRVVHRRHCDWLDHRRPPCTPHHEARSMAVRHADRHGCRDDRGCMVHGDRSSADRGSVCEGDQRLRPIAAARGTSDRARAHCGERDIWHDVHAGSRNGLAWDRLRCPSDVQRLHSEHDWCGHWKFGCRIFSASSIRPRVDLSAHRPHADRGRGRLSRDYDVPAGNSVAAHRPCRDGRSLGFRCHICPSAVESGLARQRTVQIRATDRSRRS